MVHSIRRGRRKYSLTPTSRPDVGRKNMKVPLGFLRNRVVQFGACKNAEKAS